MANKINYVRKTRGQKQVEVSSVAKTTKKNAGLNLFSGTLQEQLLEQPTNLPIRKCKVKLKRMSFATSSATFSSAVVANKSVVQTALPKTNEVGKCQVRLRRMPLGEISSTTDLNTNTEFDESETTLDAADKTSKLIKFDAKHHLENTKFQNRENTIKLAAAENNSAATALHPRTQLETQTRQFQVKLRRTALPQMDGNNDIGGKRPHTSLTPARRIAFQKLSLKRKPSHSETASNPVQTRTKLVQSVIDFTPIAQPSLSRVDELDVFAMNTDYEDQEEATLSKDHFEALKPPVFKAAAPPRPKVVNTFSSQRRSDVYDFLSQSQTKYPDPAADIIKRMIDQGKVRVATTRRGTGRPTIKRLYNAASKKKMLAERKRNGIKIKKAARTSAGVNPAPALLPVDEADENFDFDDNCNAPLQFPAADVAEAPQPAASEGKRVSSAMHSKHGDTSAEGTFSLLARSVMLQQTSTNKRRNGGGNFRSLKYTSTEKLKLLEVARKYVSTPVQKKMPPPSLHTEMLSPIAAAQLSSSITGAITQQQQPQRQQQLQKQKSNASPWRVDEDAHLPSTFNFSRNSSNGPSFSSDFIPATPKKYAKHNINKQQSNTSAHESSYIELLDDNVENKTPSPPQLLTPPSTSSSYSSNDSNAENMPPPPAVTITTNDNDINAEVFNSCRLLNPRRNLGHRSPLKAINIIDVVELQPSKTPDHNAINIIDMVELQPWKTPTKVAPQLPTISTSANSCNDSDKLDLFGFEEFLEIDENQDSNRSSAVVAHNSTTHFNDQRRQEQLGVKLQELRRWRPAADELTVAKITKPICRVFDDDEGRPKQLCIKQMLCSTIIDNNDAINERNGSLTSTVNTEYDTSHLFKEPEEPEITFDEQNPHRTYVRPYKRKRKVRNNFAMYLDSDDSGDEEAGVHTSHENDESGEKDVAGHRKKRQCKNHKQTAELNTFVNEFNAMCREVEEYQLAVEA